MPAGHVILSYTENSNLVFIITERAENHIVYTCTLNGVSVLNNNAFKLYYKTGTASLNSIDPSEFTKIDVTGNVRDLSPNTQYSFIIVNEGDDYASAVTTIYTQDINYRMFLNYEGLSIYDATLKRYVNKFFEAKNPNLVLDLSSANNLAVSLKLDFNSLASNAAVPGFVIYWGDGTYSTAINGNNTHTYLEKGVYSIVFDLIDNFSYTFTWPEAYYLDSSILSNVTLLSLKNLPCYAPNVQRGNWIDSTYTKLKKLDLSGSLISQHFICKDCTSLEEVVLLETLTAIPVQAFSGCTSLVKCDIPASVTTIGESAFENCYKLKEVKLYATSIGNKAFKNCYNLSYIDYHCQLSSAPSANETWLNAGRDAGKLVLNIGSGVTTLYTNSFNGSNSSGDFYVTDLIVNNNVTSISNSCFAYLRFLTKIDWYASVTLSSSSNLFQVSGTKSSGIHVSFLGALTAIPAHLFYCVSADSSPKVVSVSCSDLVTAIGANAFNNLVSLQTFEGASIATIGNYAFSNCRVLHALYLGKSASTVTSIGYAAFYYCVSLTSFIGNNISSLGECAFQGCYSLSTVHLSSSLTSIPSAAFSGCWSLSSINLSSMTNLSSIGESAFSNCRSLTHIRIPDSVTSIGGAAFNGCVSLSEIVLPNSSCSLGSSAFSGCINVSYIQYNCTYASDYISSNDIFTNVGAQKKYVDIDIPNNISVILPSYIFATISVPIRKLNLNAQSLNVHANAFSAASFTSLTNIYYNVASETLVSNSFPVKSGTSIVIGPDATKVPRYLINSTDIIESIDFSKSKSLTTIKSYSIRCSLKSHNITLPRCLTTIETNAFTNLTTVSGPLSIYIPAVTTVGGSSGGNAAFYNAASFIKLYVETDNTSSWGTYWNYYDTSNTLLTRYNFKSSKSSTFFMGYNSGSLYIYTENDDED